MYCINCGVELEEGQNTCPLCKADMKRFFYTQNHSASYPKNTVQDTSSNFRAHMKFMGLIFSVILFIPVFASILINILDSGTITWSSYVVASVFTAWIVLVMPFFVFKNRLLVISVADTFAIMIFLIFLNLLTNKSAWALIACGGVAVAWCVVFMPMLMPKNIKSVIECIIMDTAAVLAYLYCLETVCGGEWFLRLGMPITLIFAFLSIITIVVSRKVFKLIGTVGLSFASISIMCICIDAIVRMYLNSRPSFSWSFIVACVCVPFAVLFIIIAKNRVLRNKFIKRFHL